MKSTEPSRAIPDFLSPHKAPMSGRLYKAAILILFASVFLIAHYSTPVNHQLHAYHDIYRRMMYVPIILAAFWFGWGGGLVSAFIISILYFPHIVRDWGGDVFNTNIDQTLEIMMYFIVGGVTGGLVHLLRGKQRELEATLENLTGKTREVFEAEEQLRRSDRLAALGQLTTGLTHEIRNPLASIRGTAEILGNPNLPAARRVEFSSIMVEETRRLDEVLENFLAYARSQKPEGRPEARLGAVIDRIKSLLHVQLQAAGVKLNAGNIDSMPPLAISETLLQQVLLNLVMNAVQAMREGGEVSIDATRAADDVRILISDTGPGVPASAAPHIFDPFFSTKKSGCGLGLSIAEKIVTSQGGSIYLDCEYKNGARFVIELPVRD